MKKNQKGFGVLEAIIGVFVIIIIMAILVAVLAKSSDKKGGSAIEDGSKQTSAKTNDFAEPIVWTFNDKTGKYDHAGNPPECPDPLFAQSLVDTTQAKGILYPGQYRGGNYKPHGGFSMNTSDTKVVLPMDASLTGLTRYIEMNNVQYKLTFTNPCGVTFYYDHLYELAPEFQKVAETTPEPKENDSRGLPLKESIPFGTGDTIATKIGMPTLSNSGFDFGVLDLRQPNKISKNSTWSEIHQQFKASEWFGVCWFDQLPAADAARVKALPAVDQKSGSRSDYCANPTGTTLDVNGGKP